MKKIHLIRHAKSSWDFPNLSDHQRPLNNRGCKDAAIMSKELYKAGFSWPKIYCSSAQRAQLTIRALAEHWPSQPVDCENLIEWQTDDRLYTFNSADIWAYIRQLDEDLDVVVLIGHNPAFTDFINEATNANLNNLATCAFATIGIATVLWKDVTNHSAVLEKLIKPKMFKL